MKGDVGKSLSEKRLLVEGNITAYIIILVMDDKGQKVKPVLHAIASGFI